MIPPTKTHRKPKKRRYTKPQNTVVLYHFPAVNQVEIPQEVIFSEILPRLPVKSLIRFKTVSKTWNLTISTPQFIKQHLKMTCGNPFVPGNCVFVKSPYYFYILNFGAFDRCPDGQKGLIPVKNMSFSDNGVNTFMIGSCNGLVCFGRGNASANNHYYFNVYNPVMGKYCRIVDPLGNFQWNLMYGFGYVETLDDYLLFVGGLQRRSAETFVYVYSLRGKIWRKIGAFGEAELSVFSGGTGVLVNEALHWDMTQVWTPNVKCVCGFDLVGMRFKDVRMPGALLRNGDQLVDFRLCEMGGCLSAWTEDVNGGVEMWMLKKYGEWDSWMKLFKIDTVPGLRNFCGYTENGKVLLHTTDGSLMLVDPNQSPVEYTRLVKDLGDIEVVSYVRSLVSPY